MTDAEKALEQSDVDDLFGEDGDTESNGALSSETQDPPEAQETEQVDAKADTEPPQEPEQKADQDVDESLEQDQSQQTRHVPLAELLSEREKGRNKVEEVTAKFQSENDQLRNQLAQLQQGIAQSQLQQQQAPQQQQPEPDFYEDPRAAVQQMLKSELAPLQKQMFNQGANMSERLAVNVHGKETVDAAFQAAERAGVMPAFLNSTDPYGEMVNWHQQQVATQEIGGDLEAFKKRIAEEAVQKAMEGLKNGNQPPAQTQQPTQTQQSQRLPGTLADATNAASQGEVLENGQDWMDGVFGPGN